MGRKYVDPYRAESDANTLARAEEIKSDRSRHTAAKGHARKEAARMGKVARTVGAIKTTARRGK